MKPRIINTYDQINNIAKQSTNIQKLVRMKTPIVVATTTMLAAAELVDARVVTIHLYDDKDLCLVTHDVEDKSKLKVAECDDPYQRRTKLWDIGDAGDKEKIEYEYWRPRDDRSLCVEAPEIESGENLRLRKCGRSKSAKKRQKFGFRCCGHEIVPKMSMNPPDCKSAECSDLFAYTNTEPGKTPKPGDTIKLLGWSREWYIEDVDADDAGGTDEDDDEDVNDNACRMFPLELNEDYCIHPKFSKPTLGRPIALNYCRERDRDQHWCFDQRDRIHAYEDANLCWKASCLREGCSVKLKKCSNSEKQKWIHLEEREPWKKGSAISEPICLKKSKYNHLCVTPVGKPGWDADLELRDVDTQWLQMAGDHT